MRAPDPSRSVEFVVSEVDDGPDDDLDAPTRTHRSRLPLLVSAGIAVIALAVFMIVSNPNSTPSGSPAATASPTPSRHPQGLVVVHLAADGRGVPTRNLAAIEAMCPVGTSCDLWFDTPARAAAAVTHALPTATFMSTATLLVGDRLVSRRMTGRVGGSRLTITIGSAGPNDVLGWNASETPSSTLVTASAHVAGRLVSVSLQAPPGYNLSIPAARRLAADPRLASVSPSH